MSDRKWRFPIFLIVFCSCLIGCATGRLAAHPMGNFSINHYAHLTADRDRLLVRYVIDMAEIPTLSEKQEMNPNGSGAITQAMKNRYLAQKSADLVHGLQLSIDGRSAELALHSEEMAFRPGAGGLDILRIVLDLQAPVVPATDRYAVDYTDTNYEQRTGWKEIVLTTGSHLQLAGDLGTGPDRSRELTAYPADATLAPPQATHVDYWAWSGSGVPPVSTTAYSQTPAQSSQIPTRSSSTPRDSFTQAIARQNLTPGIIVLGLLVAFIFGAFHALSPGHGKTMVAAYLVGARGTAKHAVVLGMIVTVTHTFGVFMLGLVTLFASRYIVPERLYPVLSAISGMAVCGVGFWLLSSRLRAIVIGRRQLALAASGSAAEFHLHDHGVGHIHTHDHDHEHAHTHDHDHDHDHSHGHDHDHEHDHGLDHDHVHDHGHDYMHTHDHDRGHSHDIDHARGHTHSHGLGSHSHDVPDGPITLRTLIALGVSGGIVPCPSALVVLLSAIALHRLAYGMLLITSFSVGLASVLIAIGLLVVGAARWLDRFPRSTAVTQWMPLASAAAITTVGIVLIIRSFTQGV